ncbi:MAG: nucleotidyltransferase domain-containing protein [Eubacteriales bacterium]
MQNWNLSRWMETYADCVFSVFGERVRFIGLQGSCARGEATEASDIDVVLILDRLDYADVRRYRKAVAALPERERLCGFLSGEEELKHWDTSDLFQFYHDTRTIYGSIDWMNMTITREDARRAVHLGACNLYHMCLHNALHARRTEAIDGLYKSALFTVRAKYFWETGEYVGRRTDLLEKLTGDERKILSYALGEPGTLDEKSELLLRWSGQLIRKFKE